MVRQQESAGLTNEPFVIREAYSAPTYEVFAFETNCLADFYIISGNPGSNQDESDATEDDW